MSEQMFLKLNNANRVLYEFDVDYQNALLELAEYRSYLECSFVKRLIIVDIVFLIMIIYAGLH